MNADARFNAAFWDRQADDYERDVGPAMSQHPLCWGAFFVPEADLGALGDVAGQDVLELGCGAARWSIELARQGARCTGLDASERQLGHAAERASAAGLTVGLVHGSASDVPLADASFDVIFSDHGGLTYDDPALVVPECARLLRPGGRLVFNTASPWVQVCLDGDGDNVGRQLQRSYFELGRVEDADGITWVLTHGDWVALLVASGFAVERLHELRPPADHPVGPTHWARRWPAEDLWCATRR